MAKEEEDDLFSTRGGHHLDLLLSCFSIFPTLTQRLAPIHPFPL